MRTDTVATTLTSLGLACPRCHQQLEFLPEFISCKGCNTTFGYEEGFPDLIIGNRFEDSINAERNAYEEESYLHTSQNYFLPHFRRILRDVPGKPRILSVGCGNGVDIDVLSDAGFDAAGIECGMRCSSWHQRAHSHRLLLANGMKLPFEDRSFDLVYCGCVMPHVGTIGESHQMRPEFQEEREALAREMTRVLRPGGHVLVCSPNRWCPVDLFHGRSADHPLPRINLPSDPFLLSPGDYRRLFQPFGCNYSELLPISGYWGFVRRMKTWKGMLTAAPVNAIFNLVSQPAFGFLRPTPISPWISVLFRRN